MSDAEGQPGNPELPFCFHEGRAGRIESEPAGSLSDFR